MLGASHLEFKDIFWMQPLKVVKPRSVKVKLRSHSGGYQYEVREGSQVFCQGLLSLRDQTHPSDPNPEIDLQKLRFKLKNKRTHSELYQSFRKYGLNYGENFRVIHEVHFDHEEALSTLDPLSKNGNVFDSGVFEPSILDGVLQTAVALSQSEDEASEQWVPFHCNEFRWIKSGKPAYGYVRLIKKVPDLMLFDLALLGPTGEVLIRFSGFSKRPYSQKAALSYFQVGWKERVFPGNIKPAESPVVQVQWGQKFKKLSSSSYEVGNSSTEIRALVDDLKESNQEIIRIAFIWNWKTQALLWNSSEFCERFLDEVFQRYLWLAQGLIRSGKQVKWAHIYHVKDFTERSFHASVGGFFRTLMFENPGFFCCTVGVESWDQSSMERAFQELGGARSKLNEIRYVQESRFLRVVSALQNIPRASESLLKEKATYVITGGAGGLGFIFSKYLAEKFQSRLIWIGRRELNEDIRAKVAEIQALGGEASYWKADVTQRESLCDTLSEALQDGGSIHGVIHAAGIIRDSYILLKDYPSFQSIYRTKVLGAIHLDELTQKMDLDFFCLFSSIAALMPNQGQSDYSSGNSFLDEFSFERNQLVSHGSRKGRTISLNWPLWAEGGLQVTPEEVDHLFKFFGMNPMGTREGIQAFEASLMRDLPSDVSQLVPIPGKGQKMAEHLLDPESSAPGGRASERGSEVAAELQELNLNDLILLFSEVLEVPKSEINIHSHFNDLGLKSIAITRLSQEIKKRLGMNVKPTLFFEVTTIAELAKHLNTVQKTKVPSEVKPEKTNLSPLRSLVDHEMEKGKVYSKTWDNTEFYMVDHVVGGLFNLPGACFIEMARQAGELADPNRPVLELSNNYWAKQLSSAGEKLTARVKLQPVDDRISYEIVSQVEGGEEVFASGSIVYGTAQSPAQQSIETLKKRLTQQWFPQQIYESIINEGLHVGPTFMPMKRIYLGSVEALGEFSLPVAVAKTHPEYVLHPSLLTGVFQTALISNRFHQSEPDVQFIPLGIDSIRIFAQIPKDCYVYSKADQATFSNPKIRKFDLAVLDLNGNVCVTLKDFVIRSLKRSQPEQKVPEQEKIPNRKDTHSGIGAGTSQTGGDFVDSSSEVDQTRTEQFLTGLLASTLEMNPSEIDAQTQFEKYGINSVMIMQLNRVLEGAFGPLSKTLFFEYSNISELANYFLSRHKEKLKSLIQSGK